MNGNEVKPESRRQRRRLRPISLVLAILLLAALCTRLYGIDWDEGNNLHPDELFITHWILVDRIHLTWPLSISVLLDPARSGLNPRSADPNTGQLRDDYAYGALPLYVTETVAQFATWITAQDWHGAERVYLVGRALSALFDTLTVLVVYLIGRRLFSESVALLGAIVAALAPMSIQLAHFFTTDSWLTCFVALTLLCSIRAVEGGRVRWFVASGIGVGLSMATKGSVFSLTGVVGAAIAFCAWDQARTGSSWESVMAIAVRRTCAAAGAAIVAFALFEPYALLSPEVYLHALGRQAEIVRGTFDVPYTRQYVGTTPVLYQAEQFVKWGFGPVAGVLALVGLILLGMRAWRGSSHGASLLLVWLLCYGVIISLAETKFLRYLSPLTPVFALASGLTLDALWRLTYRGRNTLLANIVVGVPMIGIVVWSLAFLSIYSRQHPRLAASQWIYANVPIGSTIGTEYWDDSLPIAFGPGLVPWDYGYQMDAFDFYVDRPPDEMADAVYNHLQQVDYLILSSNRVSSSVTHLPWRYAVQIRFYELLESGRLGFSQVAEFSNRPRLGPIEIYDDDADESFINYDHPHVLIYKKISPE